MTTSTKLSGASIPPKPPAKGSFPLDHLSECRKFAIAYEKCLGMNRKHTSECRREAREYLQCRMERGLMAPEEWSKLGLSKDRLTAEKSDSNSRSEEQGFVAGARAAKRRKERYASKSQEQSDSK